MDNNYKKWLTATLKNEYQDVLSTEDCFESAYRYFSFHNTNGEIEVWSEEDVRQRYWPLWYARMCEMHEQAYVDEHYSFEDCLADWVAINRAWC